MSDTPQVEGPTSEANGKAPAKPKISVTMRDGRTVEFPESTKAKKTLILADGKDWAPEAGDAALAGVRFDFSNGETRAIYLSDLAAFTNRFRVHGISQKYGDEYASLKDVDDSVLAIDDLHERLTKGEWSERREGSGMAGMSVLAKALMAVFNKSQDEVKAILKEMSPAEKTALRGAPGVKEKIAELEADKAKNVDTSALLAKFGAVPA